MRIRWRNFELPSKVQPDSDSLTAEYGRFIIEPFERGFGHTIGNGLRRVLLSSIEGTAVTAVRIQGADHEFASLEGTYEDVVDIILNIKRLRIRHPGKGRITCLIDWEDAVAGDPLFEVAFWATFHPERRWDAFFAGYRKDPLETPEDRLRFWLYFLRIALMKTVLRHRLGCTDPPGRTPASQRIQRALRGLESDS